MTSPKFNSDEVARTADDLRRVLDASRQGFELARMPASAAEHWDLTDGALQHRSGGFFSINGVAREGRERVLLYQPQAAITGVVTARVNGERLFLLQARAEPGCLGEAQFGPTVQSTPANFMRLHGGAGTPFVDAFIRFEPGVSPIDDTAQLDLGERYLFKTKRSILVDTTAPVPAGKAFVWTSPTALYESIGKSAFLNIDLRSILAVSRWSSDDCSNNLGPGSARLRKSLAAPVRGDVIGALVASLAGPNSNTVFQPLQSLANWRQDDWGWSERSPDQGFAVEFFEVSAAHREVRRWVQPLVNSTSDGQVTLAVRERAGTLEIHVRAISEAGLATGRAIGPSYIRYPGEAGEAPDWLAPPRARVLTSTIESDEGGRFFRDASLYQVLEVADDAGEDHGVWLRLSELKHLLRTSNTCTIQLRGVASHLLIVP